MARVLITGSADGLGLMAAGILAGDGLAVTLHARNDRRAAWTRASRSSQHSRWRGAGGSRPAPL